MFVFSTSISAPIIFEEVASLTLCQTLGYEHTPKWLTDKGGHIELFLVPASAPRLV